MILFFHNKTETVQQIITLGDTLNVLPGEKIELDDSKLYSHELERCKNFFIISPKEKKETPNSDKSESKDSASSKKEKTPSLIPDNNKEVN